MKHLVFAFVLLASVVTALAQDSTTTITIDVYQCLSPNPPNCVAPDEASKSTCCPDCKSWGKTPLTSGLRLNPDAKYAQPKLFVTDAAEQMYGVALPKTQDGKTISVAQLYADPAKYGWVEIKDKNASKEGTIAVLPHTAGVVVKQESSNEVTVLYSSTKNNGAVKTTDLDNLLVANEQPKYLVPMAFLEKATENKSQ